MITERLIHGIVFAKAFVFSVIIMMYLFAIPVIVAFDTKVVVGLSCQPAVAISDSRQAWAMVMLAGIPDRFISDTAISWYALMYSWREYRTAFCPDTAAQKPIINDNKINDLMIKQFQFRVQNYAFEPGLSCKNAYCYQQLSAIDDCIKRIMTQNSVIHHSKFRIFIKIPSNSCYGRY